MNFILLYNLTKGVDFLKQFIFEKSNRILLSFYFILAITSIISIFLAEYNNGVTPKLFIKQIIFYGISFTIIYFMQKVSIQTYEKISILFFIFIVCILAILLISPENIAPTVNGAKSWFNFKIFTVQPSEFAKVASVGIISFLIIQNHFNKSSDIIKLLEISIILLIPFILIMKENDLGNGLYFIFLFLVLAFLVSSRSKTFFIIYTIVVSFVGLILTSALYFPTVLNLIGIKTYQLKRLLAWFNPEEFQYNYAYQITNALNEIKSGGLTGNFSKNAVYIDEQFNDFILSVIAKNFGFIGVSFFILIYFLFLLKIIFIARKCQHGNFSYYFILLTVFNFAFSFIINSYSSTGLIPVIGVSMPFISYGGSSLIANTLLFGIIIKINNTIYNEQLADEQYFDTEYEYEETEY